MVKHFKEPVSSHRAFCSQNKNPALLVEWPCKHDFMWKLGYFLWAVWQREEGAHTFSGTKEKSSCFLKAQSILYFKFYSCNGSYGQNDCGSLLSLCSLFLSSHSEIQNGNIKMCLSSRLLPSQEHSVGCNGFSWVPGTSSNRGSFAMPQPNSSPL